MAGGIDVKMGVSGVAQFKSSMNQASQSVKTLDAELKLNEKQLQATGDKETYMQQKSKLLQQQIAQQNKVIKEGQAALQAMEKTGVTPASAAYQKMQRQVLDAQSALIDMQSSLDSVGQSEEQTAQKTDKLTNSLNSINKKVSFDAVINGIGKITDGMEAAAKKVAAIATDVWNTMVDAAKWGDDQLTRANMYGMDVETLQRWDYAAAKAETTTESIQKAQQKLKKGMVSDSKEIAEDFAKLGITPFEIIAGKYGNTNQAKDATEFFWELGDALLHYGDAVDRDVMSEKYLGKSFQELATLFKDGREAFETNMQKAPIVEQENVEKLNDLSSAVEDLDFEFQTVKKTILSELSPAFTEIAKTVQGLLHDFNEYLKTDEGKAKIEALGQAVQDMFSGIKDIDAGSVLDTAKGILDAITASLGWIATNKEGVVKAIEAIGAAFVALKAAEAMTTMAQMASSLKGLLGGGNGKGAASAGETVAKSGGVLTAIGTAVKGFLGNVAAVLPFAAIPAVAIDSVASEINMQKEDKRKADEERARLKAVEAQMSASGVMQNAGYAELWALMNSPYTEGNTNPFAAMPERYRAWLYDDAEDAMMDAMAEIFSDHGGPLDALWDQWAGLMEQYLNGENVYDLENVAQLWENMRKVIEQAGEENKISIPAELNPDLAGLQEQLNGYDFSVYVTPYMGNLDTSMFAVDGSHANGLPFVPFDGYIAALHRGERIVPANQNKSYTNTSNIYFDHVNVNNGIDADGLAARIAEQNRRVMAGYGG